jgi:formylglycine-generating enzyme required for sulfatase activity
VHQVTTASFYLDITEVTNRAYSACAAARYCRAPKTMTPHTSGFEKLAVFKTDNRPVTGISQSDAAAYCLWRGLRLPTEAEFERAARGDDERPFPWGVQPPDHTRAVYGQKVTEPVGSRPNGAGPYGHMDLAGNVWEWTADRYDPLAYQRATANLGIPAGCAEILKTQDRLRRENRQGFTGSNPIPTECEFVLRGGAFNYQAAGLRASNRVHHPGGWRMIMAGFRCARDM